MSDITIRLDGLLLGLVILAGMAIFAVTALVSALLTWQKPADGRSWTITSASLWLVLVHIGALAAVIVYMDGSGALTGPDWIDWLAIPWACFILAGLVLLVRYRRRRV